MGMMIRRHRVTADPVEPVEQPKAESAKEMPKIEFEQVAVTEVVEESEKVPKTKTVKRTTTTKRKSTGKTATKRK